MNIGKMLKDMRVSRNITMDRLSKGICSKSTLMYVESNWRAPDKLLLDALLERLGKSPDKLETVLSWDDYVSLVERERICQAVDEEKYIDAIELLKTYTKKYSYKNCLHRQFIDKMRAVIVMERDKDIARSIAYLERALNDTSSLLKNGRYKRYLMSREDIHIMIMLAQEKLVLGDSRRAAAILDQTIDYIEQEFTDDELKVKIYPVAAYYRASMLAGEGNYARASLLCESAVECLAKNGYITWLPELLELDMEVQIKLENSELYEKRSRHFHALVESMKEFAGVNYESRMRDDKKLFDKRVIADKSTQEICLVNELIKNLRLDRGITQASLCEGICEPETLSRIESGRPPRNDNLKKLMERLEVERSYYNGFIDDETFEVHEIKCKLDRALGMRRYNDEETLRLLNLLKSKLDMNKKMNRQYISYIETGLKYRSGQIGNEEALEGYKQALAITLGDANLETVSITFTRTEANIIYNIASTYCSMEQFQKAMNINNNMLMVYKNSDIDIKHHYIIISLIYLSMAGILMNLANLEGAMEKYKDAFMLCVMCNRIDIIADCILNYAYCLSKRQNDSTDKVDKKETCKKFILQAKSISELIHDEYSVSVAQKLIDGLIND